MKNVVCHCVHKWRVLANPVTNVICLLKVVKAFDLIDVIIDVIMLYTYVHRMILTGNDEELLMMEHDRCMLVNSSFPYYTNVRRLLHMYMYTVFIYPCTYICVYRYL